MATLQVAWNATGVTQGGGLLTATAMNTGVRIICSTIRTTFDFFFTGADTVGLNGGCYLGSSGDLVATLMDTSGTVLNTNTPALTLTTTSPQTATYFSGLTPATQYWLRLTYNGSGNDLVQSDALVQLSGASTTPSISTVTGYGPTYNFSTGTSAGSNLTSVVGLEGNANYVVPGPTTFSGAYALANSRNGGILRFKASINQLWVRIYQGASCYLNLQSVALNGSSGIPTQIATFHLTATTGIYNPWVLLASGLTATPTLYELYCEAQSGGGQLIEYLMTSGGTGIDTSTTASSLTRTKQFSFIGDSRVQQNLGATNPTPWLFSIAQLQQYLNKQVVNAGIDGQTMATLSTDPNWYKEPTLNISGGVPTGGIIIDIGINDIKSGSPPSVPTLSGQLTTVINNIRAITGVSGISTVPIYVEAIKPYSGMTFSAIHAYNVGYQGVVSAFNAGTASGQNPSPDPNVFYIDTESWNLAGIPWKTGGSFDNTNFIDGLHLNQTGYNLEFGFLKTALGVGNATAYTLTGPTSGTVNVASTNFTVTPNGPYTGTITPATSGTGTFSPTSLSFSNSSAPQTFTYTPSTTLGSPHSISTTSSPALTNPSPISYTVNALTNNSINSKFTNNSDGFKFGGGTTVRYLTVTGTDFILSGATSTLNGTTAGTITYSQPIQSSVYKKVLAWASGYENNTAVNQTITFPVPFINTPVVVVNNTSLTISVNTTTLTITAPNNTTTFSGNIIVEGA